MAPPPPPPPMGALGPPKTAAVPDRSVLLSQIRGGATLRKAVTNDRSAPIIDANKRAAAPTQAPADGAAPKLNVPAGLAGLFAGGMPKLRPLNPTATGASPAPPSTPRSGAPSGPRPGGAPLQQPAAPSGDTPPGRRAPAPFPADLAPRGPPPLPPPSSQKPSLGPPQGGPSPVSRSRTGPPLPSKPPGVTRSASQTSLGAKRGPAPLRAPQVKPPPPPKSPTVGAVAASGPRFGTVGPHAGARLQLPGAPLARRQSFGAPDSRPAEGAGQQGAGPQPGGPAKPSGPPPPPRNVSVPSNLHQAHKSRSAPPAPPLRAPPASRPPPPPLRGQPPPLPSSLPPQLPQRNQPRPQGPAAAPRPSPTPPLRSSSMRNSAAPAAFESRFSFRPIDHVPGPVYAATEVKRYPSKVPRQNHQRQAPPPPTHFAGSLAQQTAA
ncbi:LOW QUALITY PROTEIN: proline-rich protein 2 [Ixodes scapularis]|uniref:LOW QUALITY PROTEIN: proline-rich protein 2 n=1 Tax=Ixodes scapularis TaxID=6945 RepID=UPI001A9F689A|nr:LOW QUALITY PROTEIN: proline-rich protein 2 [Ixodes scapularis]